MSSKFGTIFNMKYEKIVKGKFLSRPNRFVACVSVNGKEEKAHVKNTGRCEELLVPGAAIYLEDHEGRMGSRKLRYSLICVEKNKDRENIMVNVDSQAPNKVIKEALEMGRLILPGMKNEERSSKYERGILPEYIYDNIKPETVYGNSRLDFKITGANGKTAYAEVKGVTLENDGTALFPDAPTERGIKHVEELERAVKEGYGAYVIFVIQMKGVKLFKPNDKKHKAFGDALRHASKNGVKILAYECEVTNKEIRLGQPVKIQL